MGKNFDGEEIFCQRASCMSCYSCPHSFLRNVSLSDETSMLAEKNMKGHVDMVGFLLINLSVPQYRLKKNLMKHAIKFLIP